MMRADVVVVGAGFSGLVAATELQRIGLEVVVLEARDRVGGKSESATDELGRRVDTGGQFVCDDMPEVLALVAGHGGHLVSVDHERAGRAFVGGGEPTRDPVALWDAFDQAERAYSRLRDDDTEPCGGSLGSWFGSTALSPPAHAAARSIFSGVMCISVDEVPVEHARQLAQRTPLTRDELQYVVAGTIHAIAEDLAASIGSVHVSTPVRTIRVFGDGAVVMADGISVTARHVVVAVPPTALRTIAFDPSLPPDTLAAAAAFRAGSVLKFLIRYDRPFWRRGDVGSTAAWIDPAGLYVGEASLDESTHVLVAFLGGPATVAWRSLTPAERRRALLDRMVEAYGADAAAPLSVVERDWCPDEWGGGGYWNVVVDHDHLDAADVLRRGAPGITFASTELAPTFPGYIEGAVTAGRAAAAVVAAALRHH